MTANTHDNDKQDAPVASDTGVDDAVVNDAVLSDDTANDDTDEVVDNVRVDTEGNDDGAAEDASEGELDSGYFADDEAFLAGDDRLVYERPEKAVLQQAEHTVSWELMNFYTESGSPRRGISLRNDPPLLEIRNSDGQAVQFVATELFAKQLGESMRDVERAYHGVSSKRTARLEKEEAKQATAGMNPVQRVGYWISRHKGMSVFIVGISALAAAMGILQAI